jgi:hypothetical protein
MKSMFVIPTKNSGYIENCIKSIRDVGHTEDICVVDSNSEDKSYFDHIKKYNVIIEDISNINYVDGAIWHCYEKYKDVDFFYVLHDSMIINHNLTPITKNDFTAFCYFYNKNALHLSESQYAIQKLHSVGEDVSNMENIVGLFGITFYCKRYVLDELKKQNLHMILPRSKLEMCGSERIWGYYLWKLGYDIRISNLRNYWVKDDKTNYIIKLHPGDTDNHRS